MENFERS